MSTTVDAPLAGWGTPSGDINRLPLTGVSRLPLNIHSNAYEATRQVKTGPGVLYGFTVYSSKASAQFIQVHDLTAVPASGAIPAAVFTIGATANLPVDWVPGRVFEYGCWIVNSSTGPTYTAGLADCWFDVQFV